MNVEVAAEMMRRRNSGVVVVRIVEMRDRGRGGFAALIESLVSSV